MFVYMPGRTYDKLLFFFERFLVVVFIFYLLTGKQAGDERSRLIRQTRLFKHDLLL